ncbi:MAG: hypothetical protein IPP47_19170 [Bryobacterales bacterium]|nr:hypothetical protein [Bryobacterales bacterium]
MPVEAARINIGFLLFGAGQGWADDMSLTALAKNPPDPPSPLSATGLANVTAFARMAGYVRHFHPSDQSEQTDWDLFTVQGVRAVEGASTPEELASTLQRLFDPVAPSVRVYVAPNRPEMPAEVTPASTAGLRAVRWKHLGVDLMHDGRFSSTRVFVDATAPLPQPFEDPAKPFEASLPRGLSVMVPLTLFADDAGTLPYLAAPSPATVYFAADDRATRLAAVILAWNPIQHFYPYFDVVVTDWPGALAAALTSAATDTGEADFLVTLNRLVAAQKDGHGYASLSVPGPAAVAPLLWDWVGGALVISRLPASGVPGLAVGDRVLRIDGKPAATAIAENWELASGATPQWILWRTLNNLAECRGSPMQLEIEPWAARGTSRIAPVACVTSVDWAAGRGAVVRELEAGIWYVDLDRLTDPIWDAYLDLMINAKGIVFDMRGYPRTTRFLPNLSRVPLDSPQWRMPTPGKPDRVGMTFNPAHWTLEPAAPYPAARRVFLTDGRAASAAETELGIVEAYRLGEIVGSTTAGTNGNVNRNPLPGGFTVTFTGLKVLATTAHNTTPWASTPRSPQAPPAKASPKVATRCWSAGWKFCGDRSPGPCPPSPRRAWSMQRAARAEQSPRRNGHHLRCQPGTVESCPDRLRLDRLPGNLRRRHTRVLRRRAGAGGGRFRRPGERHRALRRFQLHRRGRRVPVARLVPGDDSGGRGRSRHLRPRRHGRRHCGEPERSHELRRGARRPRRDRHAIRHRRGRDRGRRRDGPPARTRQMARPAGKVEVTVGGVPAELAFVGVAAGLLQLKLRIPSAAPEGGGVPVTLTVSGVQARTVTVALK